MGEPRATVWPAATEEATGSYVVRRAPGWSMLTTGRPATQPAHTTTPVPAARTGGQGVPRRSAPRWPAANGWGGGSKGRVTVRSPSIGGLQRTARAGAGDGGGGRLRGGRYGREEDGRAEEQEGQEGGAHGGT